MILELLSGSMKKNKWPDFILTLAIRFIGGMILGCIVAVLLGWRGILRSFGNYHYYRHQLTSPNYPHSHLNWPLIWLTGCGLVGGIIAVCQTPYWQTPWYKGIDGNREEEIAKAFQRQKPRT